MAMAPRIAVSRVQPLRFQEIPVSLDLYTALHSTSISIRLRWSRLFRVVSETMPRRPGNSADDFACQLHVLLSSGSAFKAAKSLPLSSTPAGTEVSVRLIRFTYGLVGLQVAASIRSTQDAGCAWCLWVGFKRMQAIAGRGFTAQDPKPSILQSRGQSKPEINGS